MDGTSTRYQQAKDRVEMKVGLLIHAVAFAVVNIGLFVAAGGADITAGHFWGWGIGLAVHAGYVVATRADGWVERLIQREATRGQR